MIWTTRKIAWAVVTVGATLMAAFSIVVDLADQRGSEFFEEGDGWFYWHVLGGAVLCYTLGAIIVLIVAPVTAGEPRTRRWRRAGWAVFGFVVYGLALRLAERLIFFLAGT